MANSIYMGLGQAILSLRVMSLLRRGGEFAVVEAAPDTSPVYECGDSKESTGDMVTELSGSPPAALTPFTLLAPVPPPLPPPTPAPTPGPSPPAGFHPPGSK